MQLGLLITSRCNAACAHCATGCGPQRHEHLDEHEIRRLMEQAAALAGPVQERLDFCISGGEPFLNLPLLLGIVRHGTAVGGKVACQTNAYWASNDDKAQAILGALRAAGLHALGVSISRFHQAYINRGRVQRALAVAKALGIETTLKCALVRDDDEMEQWARACAADHKEIFPVHPYLREGERLEPAAYRSQAGLPRGPCPAAVLTVREDAEAYTCCSPGAFNSLLALGNARRQELAELRDRFCIGGAQQILRRHGPGYFADEIIRRGEGGRLRSAYADVCDLCSHIGSESSLAHVAQQAVEQFEAAQLEQLFARLALAAEA